MIHYAALGDSMTACGLPCRAPTEDEHHTGAAQPYALATPASLDPRRVDCIGCATEAALAPRCACGAPALYGAGEPLSVTMMERGFDVERRAEPEFCAEHTPSDARCQQCDRPLVDASQSFCEGCLSADSDDTGDGITRDPAGLGCGSAY